MPIKLHIALIFGLLVPAFIANAQTQDMSSWPRVIAPSGFIPKGARVQVDRLPADTPVFVNSDRTGTRTVESAASSDYMKVSAMRGASYSNPGDTADMQNRVKDGSLRVASADFAASTTNCKSSSTGDRQICDVNKDLSTSAAVPMEPTAFAAAVTGGNPARTASVEQAVVDGAGARLAALNSNAGKVGNPEYCPNGSNGSARAASLLGALAGLGSGGGSGGGGGLFGGSVNGCALSKARALHEKNRGKVKQDVMMIADFSQGSTPGKMYFVSASTGQLVNVGVPNPLDVAGGSGGFGDRGARNGCGNNKTPDGGLVTNPYRYEAGAIVKDGLSFTSLEPGKNGSAVTCGVKMHGWNPNQPTQGCFGLCGNLSSNSGNHPNLGGADYLDKLKDSLLKDGGVLVYSFTPNEANDCRGF